MGPGEVLARPISCSTVVGSRHSLGLQGWEGGDYDEDSIVPLSTGEGAGVVACLSNDLEGPGGYLKERIDMTATSIRPKI